MSDIVVTPCGSAWTIRHERILFERFDSRAAAMARARELGRLMRSRGTCVATRYRDFGRTV